MSLNKQFFFQLQQQPQPISIHYYSFTASFWCTTDQCRTIIGQRGIQMRNPIDCYSTFVPGRVRRWRRFNYSAIIRSRTRPRATACLLIPSTPRSLLLGSSPTVQWRAVEPYSVIGSKADGQETGISIRLWDFLKLLQNISPNPSLFPVSTGLVPPQSTALIS